MLMTVQWMTAAQEKVTSLLVAIVYTIATVSFVECNAPSRIQCSIGHRRGDNDRVHHYDKEGEAMNSKQLANYTDVQLSLSLLCRYSTGAGRAAAASSMLHISPYTCRNSVFVNRDHGHKSIGEHGFKDE